LLVVALFVVTSLELTAWVQAQELGTAPANLGSAKFDPYDVNDLLVRYPQGKTWRAMSVLRVNGSASKSDWGIKGESQFIKTNRYFTQVAVLQHDGIGKTHTIHLRIDVIDAGSIEIVTERQLSLVGFKSSDPLFELAIKKSIEALETVSPIIRVGTIVLKKFNEIDPGYKSVLTRAANSLKLPIDKLMRDDELRILDDPSIFSGYAFEVVWMNGYGIVGTPKQVGSPSGKENVIISIDDLNRWAVGADPLASLYVFPSLKKKIGDSWTLDAARASSVFAGRGDAQTSGKLELRYAADEQYVGRAVRNLSIRSGNLSATVEGQDRRTSYDINSMTGDMKVDNSDAMLLMANGSGSIRYDRLSTNHLLFKAEVSQDIKTVWRYEAERMSEQ